VLLQAAYPTRRALAMPAATAASFLAGALITLGGVGLPQSGYMPN
jgi:hypothetical protein